jgi:hypothetical protein
MARIQVNKRKRHTLSDRVLRGQWYSVPPKPTVVPKLWSRRARKLRDAQING